MRIDMTLVLKEQDYMVAWLGGTSASLADLKVQLTVEQARILRDQITQHLRGQGRDKPID